MHAETRDRRDFLPVMIAVLVAVVGQAAILFNDFSTGSNSHGNGNASMISAAVVSRAGAIEVPSAPPAGRAVFARWQPALGSIDPGDDSPPAPQRPGVSCSDGRPCR
jgi:hypothetical protein